MAPFEFGAGFVFGQDEDCARAVGEIVSAAVDGRTRWDLAWSEKFLQGLKPARLVRFYVGAEAPTPSRKEGIAKAVRRRTSV